MSRDTKGRFTAGNQVARGHKSRHASKVQQIRNAVLSSVTIADITEIIKVQVKSARDGNLDAAKFLMDRVLGKAKHQEFNSGDDEKIVVVLPKDFPDEANGAFRQMLLP